MKSEKNQQRHVPLEGLHNLRDLGGYAAQNGATTRWGQIYRSDSPHELTAAGVKHVAERGISTVIDLRGADELERAPNPFSTLPDYHHIPLFAGLHDRPLASANSLESLYEATLEHCGANIRAVIETIAAAEGAVLVHCTAGKDRTGIISALLLLAMGVTVEDVAADYALTATHATALLEKLLEQARNAGGDAKRFAAFLTAEPETMLATVQALHAKHRSARDYLESVSVPATSLARIERRWLTREHATT